MNLQSREGLEQESTGRLGREGGQAGGGQSAHARSQAAAAELAAAVPALKALAHVPRPAPTAEQWKAFSEGLDARIGTRGERGFAGGLASRIRAATGRDRHAADTRTARTLRRTAAAALAALAAWAAFEWLSPASRAVPALGYAPVATVAKA